MNSFFASLARAPRAGTYSRAEIPIPHNRAMDARPAPPSPAGSSRSSEAAGGDRRGLRGAPAGGGPRAARRRVVRESRVAAIAGVSAALERPERRSASRSSRGRRDGGARGRPERCRRRSGVRRLPAPARAALAREPRGEPARGPRALERRLLAILARHAPTTPAPMDARRDRSRQVDPGARRGLHRLSRGSSRSRDASWRRPAAATRCALSRSTRRTPTRPPTSCASP